MAREWHSRATQFVSHMRARDPKMILGQSHGVAGEAKESFARERARNLAGPDAVTPAPGHDSVILG